MGLFLPELGLEQARFLRLTTCQTIVGDHMSKFGGGAGRLGWLFFDYAVQDLRGYSGLNTPYHQILSKLRI